MSTIDHFAPGEFCWIELATSNQSAAKSFYTALFGWTAKDVPIGENVFYSLMELNGRVAAGLYTMHDEETKAGIPPNWKLYVAVASADETAKRAGELGAKVIDAPFDVMDRGRAAVFHDPCGAPFNIWQPNKRTGLGVVGEPGAFCWADLSTPDQARVKTFYEALFGWKLKAGEGKESGYLHIVNGENYIGGVPPARPGGASEPPHWLVYFAVADVDKTFQRAKDMKARALLRPMDFEGVGRVAMLADPHGAVFALYKEAAK
jgi:predicted enzyme related to lactoylglutathione lyase